MSFLRAAVKRRVVHWQHTRNEVLRRKLQQADGRLPAELWQATVNPSGHLAIAGHDAVDLAREYGTPLHVVNLPRLSTDFRQFINAFRAQWPRVEVGYSYKTNPLPGVLLELHQLGAWAEVISEFELWLALRLGVPPSKIIYNGPAKSDNGLRLAVSCGVALINADSLEEIDRIAHLSDALGRSQDVGVRVVSSVGWSGQFGHSLANGEARQAIARIAAYPRLKACGLHIHLGTGIRDVGAYLKATQELVQFARDVEREHAFRFTYFDLGGGFGVPTVRPITVWDERLVSLGYPPGPVDPSAAPPIESFAAAITTYLREVYATEPEQTWPTLLFEPGRAITSAAQCLLLSVLATKEAPGGQRVILDGGKNIAIPTGYELHEVLPANAMRAASTSVNDFYGPLCHPGDVLARRKKFPRVAAGDLVALMDAGAYFVPNQMNFSNPRPAAVLVDNSGHRLARARETFDAIVQFDLIAHVPATERHPLRAASNVQPVSGA